MREPHIYQHRGRTLAIGFATTVAMWAVAYVSMMKPGLVMGEVLFGVTLACLLAGGFIAGRNTSPHERPWLAGLKVGIVSASLNLLLIGSLLGGETQEEKLIQGIWWALGAYGVSIALATIGAAAGGALASSEVRSASASRNWFGLFTAVAAVTVFLLLITGGLVTGLEAGLAVPDWPNSFGHNMLLYPLSEMVGGIYYEHAHRLYGMLVGVTCITLTVSMFIFEKRAWLRVLAIGVLLAVCLQGYMGGHRVVKESIALAIAHGVFGQIVFATFIAIAAFTSATWKSDRAMLAAPSAATDRKFSLILVVLLILQLVLGALYRHLRRDYNNPPEPLHPLYTHIFMAMFVTMAAVFIGGRSWSKYRDLPVLPTVGKWLMLTVGTQLLLGTIAMFVAWARTPDSDIPVVEVVFTTMHQATGALLLAMATLLMVWTRRLLKPVAITANLPTGEHAPA